MYFEQVHLHHLLQMVLGGFHHAVHMCIYSILWSSSLLSVLSFHLAPSADHPQAVPLLHSCAVFVIVFIIILVVNSTDEWQHVIFGFLSLTYLTQHDDLQFLPFSRKWHNFIFLYGWIILCVRVCVCVFVLFSLSIHQLLGISTQFSYCEQSGYAGISYTDFFLTYSVHWFGSSPALFPLFLKWPP
jgi:hypothetical protein